jgi:hypothetical protein
MLTKRDAPEDSHPEKTKHLGILIFRGVCRFTANIAMLVGHVIVDIGRVTDGHAEPAEMGGADGTLHVIAAVGLLDRRLAFRTRFSLVVGHPLLQGQSAPRGQVAVLVAGGAGMADGLAAGADGGEAAGAVKDVAVMRDAVDLGAVGCDAVLVLGGSSPDVCFDGGFEEGFECRGGERFL